MRRLLGLLVIVAACSGGSDSAGYSSAPPSGSPGPSVPGNVGVGGAQDFAAFRDALDHGQVPRPESLDAAGFFAEHYNALPAPTCDGTFCLHAMLSVAPDLVHGGTWTLLQLGMNSPIDPRTVTRPPLDLVLVIDRSGSMSDAGKMSYAIAGARALVDALGEGDTLTVIGFDDRVETLFGPARVTDRAAVKERISALYPRGGTDIFDALETAYRAALANPDETRTRRVIFLTDGLPTAGVTDAAQIQEMSTGYNQEHVGLTTVGLGRDAGLDLLRGLAEQGGGNFYFLESGQAVAEVFTEELATFVAPLAYDVEVSFDAGAPYRVAELFGTSLWSETATGARIQLPSVYLTSRTSTDPGPSGGRRGGGSALIAELAPTRDAAPGHQVAIAHLRYRRPGSAAFITQDVVVTYADHPGVCGDGGVFSHPEVRKNEAILAFFVAFRDATTIAQHARGAARDLLASFRPKIAARLAGTTDDDLADDLRILDEYLGVLGGTR